MEEKEANAELIEKWVDCAFWAKGKTSLKKLIEEIWKNGYDNGKE